MECEVEFYPSNSWFLKSSVDSSLYVRLGNNYKLMVLIYVDDLIITGNNADSISQLKRSLYFL